MNYITHFFADYIPDKPYYNFGLALPDLVNVAERGWKPAKENHLTRSGQEVLEIWNGYQQHIKADAHFHNLVLFTTETKRIRIAMEDAGLAAKGIHLFFAAHVLLEMLIDRHIIKTRRPIAELFYSQLEAVPFETIETFFLASGNTMTERFPEFFSRFKESKYLLDYVKDDAMYYSVNRLLSRTRQPVYDTDVQKKAFEELIENEEILLWDKIETFLANPYQK